MASCPLLSVPLLLLVLVLPLIIGSSSSSPSSKSTSSPSPTSTSSPSSTSTSSGSTSSTSTSTSTESTTLSLGNEETETETRTRTGSEPCRAHDSWRERGRRRERQLAAVAVRAARAVVHESRALAGACLIRRRHSRKEEEYDDGDDDGDGDGDDDGDGDGDDGNGLEFQAIEDCVALMDNARSQLDRAIGLLLARDPRTTIVHRFPDDDDDNRRSLVLVRLSSALALQSTCSDGFRFVTLPGKCASAVVRSQDKLSELLVRSLDAAHKLAPARCTPQADDDDRQVFEQAEDAIDTTVAASARARDARGPTKRRARRKKRTSQQRRANPACGKPTFVERPNVGAEKSLSEMASCPPPPEAGPVDIFVAQDGSGQFTNITSALESLAASTAINGSSAAASGGGLRRIIVYIKQGIYDESFEVPRSLVNLTLVGDGAGATIVTGNKSVGSGLFNTLRTATVGIIADGFMARDMTFRNTAGPLGFQAVALRVEGDMAVFYRCSIEGYQDTLYALAGRQFYRECDISGTVDFVFGNAVASFQTCRLIARRPIRGQQNAATAQGRRVAADVSGFAFQNCSVEASPELLQAPFRVRTYLGRPWKPYSRVVFLDSFLGALVDSAGWLPWNASNPYTDTVFYAEFRNRGPGSIVSDRVPWRGVHPSIDASEAEQFTADNFILGPSWLPLDLISYTFGLDPSPTTVKAPASASASAPASASASAPAEHSSVP